MCVSVEYDGRMKCELNSEGFQITISGRQSIVLNDSLVVLVLSVYNNQPLSALLHCFANNLCDNSSLL